LPNTGASPKKNAEINAELMPVIRPLCISFFSWQGSGLP
jgi:hypothetical protein